MVAMWPASQPTVPDLACGFQPHCVSSTRSRTLRVFFISSSNSMSIDCPIVMLFSLRTCLSRQQHHRRNKSETSSLDSHLSPPHNFPQDRSQFPAHHTL